MKRLIYQVSLGGEAKSKLYEKCIESVADYCKKYAIDHKVQKEPILRIKPDPFTGNRSNDSYMKHGGFLPIYEKENAFDLLDDYDQIAIIDADVYIRPDAGNAFEEFGAHHAFGAVVEREMPLTSEYKQKITNYSRMQYATLQDVDWKWNGLGGEFCNMGVMFINSNKFKPYLRGQTAKQFLDRYEFKRFIDGEGAWKWSTDQTLLNWWIKKTEISIKHLDWKWNGLFTANTKIEKCDFVHFFLKDKLPNGGEDIDSLLRELIE